MPLPERLLNSCATIYLEANAKGSMGQPVQTLTVVGTPRCRVDFKSIERDGPPIEGEAQTFSVYLAGSWPLTASHWVKVHTASGRVATGQVATSSEAAGLGHNTALTVICRTPVPVVAS